MNNMLLGLFDNSFIELLGKSSFWFTLAGIIGLIIIAVFCLKYPKLGGPILLSLFGVVLVALDIFCILQINTYYTAEGGIHGKLTGIFKTNEIEVVDNLKFEVKNIELKETSDGVYSASITTDQVLSLDTRESLGVFINGMPCDTTSEVHSDFAIANYVYTFYDNSNFEMCTDTLILNFAFYEKSTYLSLTTKGGTLPVEECVEYWHHYFNKNGFIVEIAPFIEVSKDVQFSNGDISNYSVIRYYVDNLLYATDVESLNTSYTFRNLDIEGFIGWCTEDGLLLDSKTILTSNLNLYAKYTSSYDFMISYVVDGETSLYPYVQGTKILVPQKPSKSESLFLGWSLDGSTILNLEEYEITSDTTFIAVFDENVGLYDNNNAFVSSWEDLVLNGDVVVSESTLKDVRESLVGKLVVPESITIVGNNAFRRSSLIEVVLSEGITSIESYAFSDSLMLKNIYMFDGIESIGNSAFSKCVSLECVKLPNSITSMGSGVFSDCSNLKEVSWSTSCNTISAYTFSECLSLNDFVVPQSISTINSTAFWGCINLKTLYIPSSVDVIKSEEHYSNSIVYQANPNLVIYCEDTEKQVLWGAFWNYCDENTLIEVKYSYSYDQYLSEINKGV